MSETKWLTHKNTGSCVVNSYLTDYQYNSYLIRLFCIAPGCLDTSLAYAAVCFEPSVVYCSQTSNGVL